MDLFHYTQESMRQLSNDKFYVKLPHDLTETHVEKVKDIL